MIGLGKWQADIDNILFKGAAVFTIADENGNYNKVCYLLDYTLNGDTTEFYATIDFLN